MKIEVQELKIIDTSYGGITGINDYYISDGRIITCKASEIKEILSTIPSSINKKQWKKI